MLTPRVDCINLTLDTNYSVGVATVNMEGEGPIVTVNTSTTCLPPALEYNSTTVTLGQTGCSHR